MRGKKAKELRKAIYGKEDSPLVREYRGHLHEQKVKGEKGEVRIRKKVSVFNIGLRQQYQKLKKFYYRKKKGI